MRPKGLPCSNTKKGAKKSINCLRSGEERDSGKMKDRIGFSFYFQGEGKGGGGKPPSMNHAYLWLEDSTEREMSKNPDFD